ncbi:uncharacterized protein N7496_001196 [Penicillium cataractarum]|uniref:AMMECR1 domain-containing protein n=1 Tax=Penicillium cataractarum TaxID=2100454 RepID=A0A9W9VVL6_9EURO|nr:uncharacterized protein N7496_001196 [Penicillium cataractarum]KAJ5390128.1 hypothetical protein N7496_001196 [Penicillium cataractarum]
MANTAQCFYCFESLLASFEDREPPSLTAIETLWEQHEQSKKLSRLGDQDLEEEGEDADVDAGLAKAVDDLDADADAIQSSRTTNRPHGLKLPSINRLQSQVSSDSSSTATTPSCASNTSSNSTLSGSTTVTTPSAQSEGTSSRAKSAEQRYPLFVTWNTVSRGHKSLRGCIGTFEAQDLAAGLNSYALTSAFDDTRFSPIPQSLLPSLSCSLTLLGSFEPCTNAMDWTLGTHGIRISFIHRGRRYGATYLPDVAVEQEWTKEETVESLMRKAGWDGGAGGVARRFLRTGTNSSGTKPWDQVSDFRTVRYQGLKASASYEEWQEWRTWVLSLDDGREILVSV